MAKKPETMFDMDITKMMAEFKLPQVDVEAVLPTMAILQRAWDVWTSRLG